MRRRCLLAAVCLPLVFVVGVCRWCLPLVFVVGVCRWCLPLAFAVGVCRWRLPLVLVSRVLALPAKKAKEQKGKYRCYLWGLNY
jgi:hypothetical protein